MSNSLPVHDLEAERMVIGGLVLGGFDPKLAEQVREACEPGDFFQPMHGKVVEAIFHLADQGVYDAKSVVERIGDEYEFTEAGGINWLIDIIEGTSSEAMAPHYAGVVSELATKRRIMYAAEQLASAAGNGKAPDELLGMIADLQSIRGLGGRSREKTIWDIIEGHPVLSEPVVDGLVRRGEVANIIAPPKAGKSWLMYNLALSIATGADWLDTFRCKAGQVLIIDNELHPQTIANRLPKVADAMRLGVNVYGDKVDILSLRGRGVTLDDLNNTISRMRGKYQAIILDAWYRFIPPGCNENSNSDITQLFNTLDKYAEVTGAAWFIVHHASKGKQGEKSVTDVGAGAGSQSRAADAHIILREHEEPGCMVMDAAVRSFQPVEPFCIRWDFPLWRLDESIDSEDVKGRKSPREEKQEQKDSDGKQSISLALMKETGQTARRLRQTTGISRERLNRLLDLMEYEGLIEKEPVNIKGNDTFAYCNVEQL